MTDGVTVTLTIQLTPEAAEHFAAGLPGLFVDTRKFPGCRGIEAFSSQSDPGRFIFIERWDSAADYHAYLAWRDTRGEGLGSITAVSTAPPVVEIWDGPIA